MTLKQVFSQGIVIGKCVESNMPTFVGEMRETKYLEKSNIDEVNETKKEVEEDNMYSKAQ